MSGLFVRIKRDGRFQNLEIEQLTDEERAEFFYNHANAELSEMRAMLPWINALCRTVRNFEDRSIEMLLKLAESLTDGKTESEACLFFTSDAVAIAITSGRGKVKLAAAQRIIQQSIMTPGELRFFLTPADDFSDPIGHDPKNPED